MIIIFSVKKMRFKKVFGIIFTVIVCSAVFFLFSAAYLDYSMKNESETEGKAESEPYYWYPTSSGVLFKFESGQNCLIYLDFERGSSVAVFTELESPVRIGKYTVDYTVNADLELIAGIIDRLGGLETESEGEAKRLTGIMVTDMISKSSDTKKTSTEFLYLIFDEIAKKGFSKDDFVYIIKNTDTDLLVPDCFYWEDYMQNISKDFEVIS